MESYNELIFRDMIAFDFPCFGGYVLAPSTFKKANRLIYKWLAFLFYLLARYLPDMWCLRSLNNGLFNPQLLLSPYL